MINLASLRQQYLAVSSHTKNSNHKNLFTFADDDPRRLNHLSLEQQKKRAKERLRQWRASNDPSMHDKKLSDAQFSIASDYGFNSWPRFKAYLEQVAIAEAAIKNGEPSALDGDHKALHIRCGHDIQQALAIAGFNGDFLVSVDPYAHGPVPTTETLEQFVEVRARYISSDGNPPYEQVYSDLMAGYLALEKAIDYDAVYLWFEHDSFDQLILARLLSFFSDPARRPRVLKMISTTHFPGVKRFNGLGHLPPQAMRLLWNDFRPVTQQQLSLGTHVWDAICAPTPQKLQTLIQRGMPELPVMQKALQRHLQQLPSTANGLNLTEHLTLQILRDKGTINAARLFGWYTNHYEPLTFMGDSPYWRLLADLAEAEQPAIIIERQGRLPKEWQVSLTSIGEELLDEKVDWLEINTVDYWLGGTHISTRENTIYRSATQLE